MVSELDPGWTYELDPSAIIVNSWSLFILLMIYYMAVECWWQTIAFSSSLILG